MGTGPRESLAIGFTSVRPGWEAVPPGHLVEEEQDDDRKGGGYQRFVPARVAVFNQKCPRRLVPETPAFHRQYQPIDLRQCRYDERYERVANRPEKSLHSVPVDFKTSQSLGVGDGLHFPGEHNRKAEHDNHHEPVTIGQAAFHEGIDQGRGIGRNDKQAAHQEDGEEPCGP